MKKAAISDEVIKEEYALVEAAKKHPPAFQPLYDQYYPIIFRFIFNKVRDRELSAELTAQVFLAAMLKLPSYTFKGMPFSAWLYRIASNEVGQYFRKAKRNQFVIIDERLLQGIAEENYDMDMEDRRSQLEAGIQLLTEPEIQLLDLRFLEEKSFKEIGFILDITENNAKVKTYRLLDKLRDLLKSPLPAPADKKISFLDRLKMAVFF